MEGKNGTISRFPRILSAAAVLLLACPGLPAEPRAKAVIQIWMWGGPPQTDTFDPKPEAGYDYTGPLAKPIDTNVEGIRIGAMLPLLARQADKYSLIRSMTHGIGSHETAAYMMQTGREAAVGPVYPSVGAVVSYLMGAGRGYAGRLPPYVVLTEAQGRFAEEGFLGPRYKPFITGGDPARTPFAVEGIVAEGISDEQQAARRGLRRELDSLGQALPNHADFLLAQQYEKTAYDMILGDARRVYDLSEETDAVRDLYGRNTFGQSCLTARRLVERGVLYVTVNYKGWDTHKQHFEAMNRMLPEFDRGLAALLSDLSARGLLSSTIVWCCGEFGRTPKISWEAPWNGGRQHYGNCFSVLVAGGGFRGGRVVGASDATGESVAARPVYPQDLIGSLYELLGIDPAAAWPAGSGGTGPVIPPASDKSGAGILREIM